jgi:hypothetical protein
LSLLLSYLHFETGLTNLDPVTRQVRPATCKAIVMVEGFECYQSYFTLVLG